MIHRATITIRFQSVVFCRYDFRQYPFDKQTLELTVKLLSIEIPGRSKKVRPVVRHPDRFRIDDHDLGGHKLMKDCDCLPEFDFVGLAARAYSSS